jgi:uncharacterized protein YbaR (Trm112 family)
MNEELLKILCCPETRQPLRLAPPEVMATLNQRIQAGGVRNRGGQIVTGSCEAGLLRDDGRALYPVRGGLPILLIAEALEMDGAN